MSKPIVNPWIGERIRRLASLLPVRKVAPKIKLLIPVDLTLDMFPITLQLLDRVTREICWEITADGPTAIRIPSDSEVNDGWPTDRRFMISDGRTYESMFGSVIERSP